MSKRFEARPYEGHYGEPDYQVYDTRVGYNYCTCCEKNAQMIADLLNAQDDKSQIVNNT